MNSGIVRRRPTALADHGGGAPAMAARLLLDRRVIAVLTLLAAAILGACERSEEYKAFSACFRAVSAQAKYPSAADFGYYEVERYGSGYRVVGRVELLNAFGAMIPHRYVCRYRDGRAEVVAVRPG